MIERPGRPVAETTESSPEAPKQEVTQLAAADRTGKSPAFQFYPKDFLSSSKVQRMSLSERGAYITLLSFCWLDGSIPTDTKEIASMVGIPAAHFAKLWAGPLGQCFTEKSGRLVNDRLEDERKKQAQYRKQQADRAGKGWAKRKLHQSGNATALQSPHDSGNALQFSSAFASSSSSAKKNTDGARETPLDEQAQRLLSEYPDQGKCSIHAVTAALGDVLRGAPGDSFDALLARLDGHKRSAKWAEQGGRFIPRLDRYLTSGTHLQTMPSVEDVDRESTNAKLPAWARSK